MHIFIGITTLLLSMFSTAVMSYIAMATPIGPWIAPTLVLITALLFRFFSYKKQISEAAILITVAGSVGGIAAIALGFSLPTLYFLDQHLFNAWMGRPVLFSLLVSIITFFGGWFGLWIANRIESTILIQQELPFPIAQLVYKMVVAADQIKKSYDLAVGFCSAFLFSALQDGLLGYAGIIPKSIVIIRSIPVSFVRLPFISFDLWPLLWAIGFVTGQMIVVPLAVAIILKILFLDPMHLFCFAHCTTTEFIFAFCSGMVLASAVFGVMQMFPVLYGAMCKNRTDRWFYYTVDGLRISRVMILETGVLFSGLCCLLFYFQFSVVMQLYLLAFSYICAYQIAQIAGRIGLAQLGRFATFVMVPAMFLFNVNKTQIVFIALFVELCGGVCTDILCGRKVAYLAGIAPRRVYRYQYAGLVISSCVIGGVFWLLINHFGLGSPELFAQRAQARHLLVAVQSFDYAILLLGSFFGYGLSIVGIHPMLVLGGLLMPITISLGLIVGGVGAMVVADKEEWYPFWSGVFAANSVWMLLRTVM
ncbi:MAG TPA: OPT/YSL family transporter [Candidatus Babeliales bacterium]|nr:OPT/YSL family transporter [Candidatus Babeliales bacterium]